MISRLTHNVAFKSTFKPLGFRSALFSSLKSSKSDESTSTGHQSSNNANFELSPEEQAILTRFRDHQSSAARLSIAEEVRTLVDQSTGYGVLATNSLQYSGFPTGFYLPWRILKL
jgi:hypothetical protein